MTEAVEVDPLETVLREHDARMQALSERATADTLAKCDYMMQEIATAASQNPALRRAVRLRDQVQEAINGSVSEVPPGVDVTSGTTPTGLTWYDITDVAPLHDIDTVKGKIQLTVPWSGQQQIDATVGGIRGLGFDGCEVTKGRQAVQVTDAEIEQGKIGRDVLQGVVNNGGTFQASPDGAGRRDNYGRPLAWLRIRNADGSYLYLAEWAKANKFDRNVWLATQGQPA